MLFWQQSTQYFPGKKLSLPSLIFATVESWGEETFCIKGVSDNLKEGEGEGWGN